MAGYNLKQVMNKPERLAPGHRMCAGCGATIGVGVGVVNKSKAVDVFFNLCHSSV